MWPKLPWHPCHVRSLSRGQQCLADSWLSQYFVHIVPHQNSLDNSRGGGILDWSRFNLVSSWELRSVNGYRTRMTLPIVCHLGFPVTNLLFNLQLFRQKNFKLIILCRISRRNTVLEFYKDRCRAPRKVFNERTYHLWDTASHLIGRISLGFWIETCVTRFPWHTVTKLFWSALKQVE